MDALMLFLFALDFLLAVMLLDAERTDEPRRRLEHVEARRRALRRREANAPEFADGTDALRARHTDVSRADSDMIE